MLFCLLMSVFSLAQQIVYRNGVKQGTVKVKFSSRLTETLRKMSVSSGNKLITGIKPFDLVSEKVGAKKMQRLFPENPDPKLEAKLRKHKLDLWYIIEVNPEEDPLQVALKYKNISEVQIAEVEKQIKLSNYTFIPLNNKKSISRNTYFNDPRLIDQWHYKNNGQTGYPNGADINLLKAWDIVKGSPEIIVSIHDEGVDVKHPDLRQNIWQNLAEINGKPGVDDDGNGYIDDFNGWNFDKKNGNIDPQSHGTHVAGTISAVNNNGIGVSGIAGGSGNNDGVKVMSLQSLGGGKIEQSYIYAANNGAVISQNSWGYTTPGSYEQSVQDAIDYFIEEAGNYSNSPMKGGIVIFAAGNSNSDNKWYPGFYEKTLTVASIGPDWKKASYSNFGSWVDISAPGGETDLGANNGILSTLPNSQYGFYQGTSMACPHVSGVAALALANRKTQLTPETLKNKLLTGVVEIDSKNPNYALKLGSGNIDAFLAIQNDEGIAPNTITNLKVEGIAQEFVNLSWSVPNDQDDAQPKEFRIYFHTSPITAQNFTSASFETLKNNDKAGETINYTIKNLLGQTTYYFAVISSDRWENTSDLSNITQGTTNKGPKIDVDEKSKNIIMNLDENNSFKGLHNLNILNNDDGVLKWEFLARHREASLSYFSTKNIQYPSVIASKNSSPAQIGKRKVSSLINKPSMAISAYTEKEKFYSNYPTNVIGETNNKLTNSSATKFYVNDAEGFNLTQIQSYLKADPNLGPIIVEVYRGTELNKNNLVYAQEYLPYSGEEHYAYVNLNEQLYFKTGETFWVVVHIPSGNLFPLGIGYETTANGSDNCYISFDLGQTWGSLSEAIDDDNFAWVTIAKSNNKYLGEYLTLDPNSGEINGNQASLTKLSADGSKLQNGTYYANVILKSNDAMQQELKLPITLNVSGHPAEITSIETLDFANVFNGTSKELSFIVKNVGLGNFNDVSLEITNPNFKLVGLSPFRIAADEEIELKIIYTPTAVGNDNGTLILSSGSSAVKHKIILFGVATEPAKIKVNPIKQTVDNITIGDKINTSIEIENTGKAALKYFIPKFDTSNISKNWIGSYNKFGYKVRSNSNTESDPIAYEYTDISSTGKDITEYFKKDGNRYFPINIGFDFPYYGNKMNTLYINHQGFTTFDNSISPINMPDLNGAPFTPKGYISILGTYTELSMGGSVFYQVDADKIIVQYSNIGDGWSGTLSAQMVIYSNGNIRFFYNQIDYPSYMLDYLNILIEDFEQQDGILINGIDKKTNIYSGLALGFDFPGPDIITSISNAGGIILPGETAKMDIVLDTTSLHEGNFNKYINIVSSDPFNSQTLPLIALNIINGGTPKLELSTNEITFGEIFQGAVSTKNFSIKNTGTAAVSIENFEFKNNKFQIIGDKTATIAPGLNKLYQISIPTDVITELTDTLTITDGNNNIHSIKISGTVVAPPAITINNLDEINQELNHGETISHPLLIENTGSANLEVVATGNDWLTLSANKKTSNILPSFSYNYEMYNDGSNYQWQDIREKGTQLPFPEEVFNPSQYWKNIQLPWSINYYGKEYSNIYIGYNGIVTFDEPTNVDFFNRSFPSNLFKTLIAPYWAFAGFETSLYPKKEIGIFYSSDSDKFIISWEYFSNYFGGIGDPISAQVIFYKNGTMKFQYKLIGNLDFTTKSTTIGLQNSDQSDFVNISFNSNVNHGNGLVYILSPAKKHIIPAGSTLAAQLDIDARNIYSGDYTGTLKIKTNAPQQEYFEKIVHLKVLGDPLISSDIKDINYGDIFIDPNSTYTKEFYIINSGSKTLQISNMIIESGTSDFKIETYIFVPGWFGGGFWTWMDIKDLWTGYPSILPGEKSKYRISYYPNKIGKTEEKLVVESNAKDPVLSIPILANVSLPPLFELQTESITSNLNLLTETDTKNVIFNNKYGIGTLQYELAIDYLRKSPFAKSYNESIQKYVKKYNQETLLQSIPVSDSIKTNSISKKSFNRELSHENADDAETYLGFDGSLPFTTATKFNAGNKGFTLSHIQSFINTSKKSSGNISYEIRAGGTSIIDAVTIDKGNIDYTYTGTEKGYWISLPISNPKEFYPNEDFYIILTYPFDLAHAQGAISGVDQNPGRYMFEANDIWYDLQSENVYPGYAWLVRAAETNFVNNAWVSINNANDGNIPSGESKTIQLDFNAANGERGDQFAILKIRTNDPIKKTGQVPIKLHINQAPSVSKEFTEDIKVNEASEKLINYKLSDPENNTINIELKNAPIWATAEIINQNAILKLTPDYKTAGTYSFILIAKDQYNAITETKVEVEVLKTNRAPIAKKVQDIFYSKLNHFDVRLFNDYFTEPDDDEMSYSLKVDKQNIISTTIGQEQAKFVIETLQEGECLLTLIATDSYGAITEQNVKVIVRNNKAPDALEYKSIFFDKIGKSNSFSFEQYFIDADGDKLTYLASIKDASITSIKFTDSQFTLESLANGETELNLTATDPFGASKQVKVTVFVIEKNQDELSIYPNPVVDKFKIKWGNRWIGNVNLEIISSIGSILKKLELKDVQNLSHSEIDLSNLNSGIYYLKVTGKEGTTAIHKIIKK